MNTVCNTLNFWSLEPNERNINHDWAYVGLHPWNGPSLTQIKWTGCKICKVSTHWFRAVEKTLHHFKFECVFTAALMVNTLKIIEKAKIEGPVSFTHQNSKVVNRLSCLKSQHLFRIVINVCTNCWHQNGEKSFSVISNWLNISSLGIKMIWWWLEYQTRCIILTNFHHSWLIEIVPLSELYFTKQQALLHLFFVFRPAQHSTKLAFLWGSRNQWKQRRSTCSVKYMQITFLHLLSSFSRMKIFEPFLVSSWTVILKTKRLHLDCFRARFLSVCYISFCDLFKLWCRANCSSWWCPKRASWMWTSQTGTTDKQTQSVALKQSRCGYFVVIFTDKYARCFSVDFW